MTTRKPTIIHPALLAIYPVLFLYSRNMDEVRLGELPRPVIVLLAAAMMLFLISRLLVRDWVKAGLLTSLMVLMAFVYSPIFEHVRAASTVLFGFPLARHRLLLPVWGIVILGFGIPIIRTRRNLVPLTTYANILALVLVCFSLITIVGRGLQTAKGPHTNRFWEGVLAKDEAIKLTPKKPLRDIYFIVLDKYGRADSLQEQFGYDNTPFLEDLKSKGFYVATNAHSCTKGTYSSLAGTLNLDFVSSLLGKEQERSDGTKMYKRMIEDNRICLLLKREGYEFVFFPSGFQTTTTNRNADLTIEPPGTINLSEFERTLVSNSVLAPFITNNDGHRRRLLYTFEQLERIPDIKQPTFTFAHILCPHDPYVFDKDGSPARQNYNQHLYPVGKEREQIGQLYIEQLQYLNKRMEGIVDAIIAKSEVPPIIILQADHGMFFLKPNLEARPKYSRDVLSAFYFPDGGDAALSDSMLNVNTFRALLDFYFGANLRMLDDQTNYGKAEGDQTTGPNKVGAESSTSD